MSFPCFFAIFVTVKSKQMAGNDCCIKRSAIILRAFMLFFRAVVFQYSREAVRRLHRQFADAPLYTELPVGGAYSDLGIVPAARTPGHRLVDGPVARFRHRAALRRNGDAADDRRVCRHRRVRPGTDCRRSIYLDIHCRDIRGAGIQGIRLRAALPIRPLGGFCPRHY